jgi:hypothetical protein
VKWLGAGTSGDSAVQSIVAEEIAHGWELGARGERLGAHTQELRRKDAVRLILWPVGHEMKDVVMVTLPRSQASQGRY